MQKSSKIFVAGHAGLVGSAIVKVLQKNGFENLILKTHAELDLCDQAATEHFFATQKPEFIFFCAAKVGGMLAQLEQKAVTSGKSYMVHFYFALLSFFYFALNLSNSLNSLNSPQILILNSQNPKNSQKFTPKSQQKAAWMEKLKKIHKRKVKNDTKR